MVTRLKTARKEDNKAFLSRIQEGAASFVKGWHGNRNQLHTLSMEVIDHAIEHGDHSAVMYLQLAADALPNNLRAKWVSWLEAYTPLRIKRNTETNRAISPRSEAYKAIDKTPDNVSKLWTKEKGVSWQADEARAKPWYEYTKPNEQGAAQTVNVPDAISRLIARIQTAINNDTAMGADGKLVRLATIQKMLTKAIDELKPKAVVAGREEGKVTRKPKASEPEAPAQEQAAA